VAFASDVILGALDTAELPKAGMNPMSACNRQARAVANGKAHEFNELASNPHGDAAASSGLLGTFCR